MLILILIVWSCKSWSGGDFREEVGKQSRGAAGNNPISRIDDSRDPRPPLYLVLWWSRVGRRRMPPRGLPLQFATYTPRCLARRRRCGRGEGRFSFTGHVSALLQCSFFSKKFHSIKESFQVLCSYYLGKTILISKSKGCCVHAFDIFLTIVSFTPFNDVFQIIQKIQKIVKRRRTFGKKITME